MPTLPIQRYMIIDAPDSNIGYWFDALGWIAGYFAQLEWASYAIIDRLGSPGEKTKGVRLPYKARTELAAQLVDVRLTPLDAALAAEWSRFWQRAVDAAPMRNNILHNPLTVNLHGMATMSDSEGIKLMTKSGAPLIELGEAQAFSRELHELNVQMLDLFQRTTF